MPILVLIPFTALVIIIAQTSQAEMSRSGKRGHSCSAEDGQVGGLQSMEV